jgi:hypothetical protein
MRHDGLIERPGDRRGYDVLSSNGRGAARRLQGRPSVNFDGSPAARRALSAAPPTDRKTTGTRSLRRAFTGPEPSYGRELPRWARELPVGSWRPYRPPLEVRSAAPEAFTWDADEKDAHTREHAEVLTRLAEVLARAKCPPVEGHYGRLACDLLFQTPAPANATRSLSG